MGKRHAWALGASGLLVAAACATPLETETTPDVSAATIASFAPDPIEPCDSVLPFPSDIVKNPTTLTLDLPFCQEDDADTIGIKTGLRTLDGYALNTTIYTTFSGPIDAATLTGNVVLLRTDTGEAVPVTPIWRESESRVYLILSAPLAEGTTYAVGITSGVKDAAGADMVSDQAFVLVKSTESLIDAKGFSSFSAVPNANAFGLEPIRMAFAPIFDVLEGAGYARGDLLVAWSFTTQSINAALVPLRDAVQSTRAVIHHENSIPAAAHPLLAAAGIPTSALCDIHTGTFTLNSLLADTGTFGPAMHSVAVDYILSTPADPVSGCVAGTIPGKILVYAHGLGRCKNDSLAVANSFAGVGYATLALDGPRAGGRTLGNLGDQNLDSCPDQPATPELILLGDANPNPFGVRDRLRQWGLELAQVATAVKAAPWELIDADAPTGTPPAPAVAVLGHSFGGIAAILGGSVSMDMDLMAVTGASGMLATAFSPLLEAGLAGGMALAGMDPTTASGAAAVQASLATAVASYQWALEPADPVLQVAAMPASADMPLLIQVVDGLTQQAPLHETATQAALAAAHGRQAAGATTFELACADVTDTTCNGLAQTACTADAGCRWSAAVGTCGAATAFCDTTVDVTDPYCGLFTTDAACAGSAGCRWDTTAALCGMPDNSSTVGAMLQPCIDGCDVSCLALTTSVDCGNQATCMWNGASCTPLGNCSSALTKLQTMQTQLVSFVASGGACIDALNPSTGACDPLTDTTLPCQ